MRDDGKVRELEKETEISQRNSKRERERVPQLETHTRFFDNGWIVD